MTSQEIVNIRTTSKFLAMNLKPIKKASCTEILRIIAGTLTLKNNHREEREAGEENEKI